MSKPNDYSGVIKELVAGTWRDPQTGRVRTIPVRNIVIADDLAGEDAGLVEGQHHGKAIAVVSDERTREALGRRIFEALRPRGNIGEFVWAKPAVTPEGLAELAAGTEGAEALVAVGSGTISDSVKYLTFLSGREYSVFPTSPMNAYTTPTASVLVDGFKQSITCHAAKGVFFDLGIVSKCPKRLIAAAFADVVCRTTSQVDWLMSHLLFDTPYEETAYTLLAYDEAAMMTNAASIVAGDPAALAMLTRICALMGLATTFTGTTHVGSMAEHMISHYIDMFAGAAHPGTSHGEQVGVATLAISRLQNAIVNADRAPQMQPTVIPERALREKFGAAADEMIAQTERKALDAAQTAKMNERLEREWPSITRRLRAVMLPYERLRDAMEAAGCQRTAADLGLDREFFRDAIRYARFIRDRYSILDVAGDSGQLEAFARTCE